MTADDPLPTPAACWLIAGAAAALIGTLGWSRAASQAEPRATGAIRIVRGASPAIAPRPIREIQPKEPAPSIALASLPVIDPAYRPLADAMRRAYPEVTRVDAECADSTCTILAVVPATVEQAAHGRLGGTLSDGIERVLTAQGYAPLQQIQFEEISAEDLRVRITLDRS